VPGVLSVSVGGIEGESLMLELEGQVLASSGSACSSGSAEGSYVLRALGRSELAAQGSLRLSLGRTTTESDVDRAAAAICAAVARLRALAPAGAVDRIA
jgi:cysteine desulfurase